MLIPSFAWISPENRRRGAIALGILALALIAFACGRFSAGKPQIKEVEKIVYQDRVVEKVVTVKAEAATKTMVVYRERTTKPDGTKVEREEERAVTDTQETTHVNDDKTVTVSAVDDKTLTVTAVRPNWHVSLIAGASLELKPFSAVPTFGVAAEHRFLGPFFLGAQFQYTPATMRFDALGRLSMEF